MHSRAPWPCMSDPLGLEEEGVAECECVSVHVNVCVCVYVAGAQCSLEKHCATKVCVFRVVSSSGQKERAGKRETREEGEVGGKKGKELDEENRWLSIVFHFS